MSATSALERCVGDVDGFLAGSFATEPHLHRGAPFDDLLSLADVDRALTGAGLRRPAVRIVRDGGIVDPATWTRRARTGAVTVADVVDPARVLDLFADGATIVLQSLHRWWPPVSAFCRELELALTHAVQANAYLTPAGAAGLAPHHDTHDVFVLQLHGAKHWTVRAPVVDAPLPRHRSDPERAARQAHLFDAELSPGHCLYLPRGAVHSARAQGATSLHLTIGVLATTGHDVVRRVAELAGDDPALRRTLPAGWADDPAVAATAVQDVLDRLRSLVSATSAADVAEHLADRFVAARLPMLPGQLLQLDALGAIDDTTTVRRRDGLVCTWRVADGRLRLRAGDRTLDLPAAAEGAVRRLLDGAPLRVAELSPHADAPSRLVLVRRMVREGLVVAGEVAGA